MNFSPESIETNALRGAIMLTAIGVGTALMVWICYFFPLICCWVALTLLVYAFLLYPLAVFVLARAQRKFQISGVRQLDILPTVAVIIPAHNEEKLIVQKVANTLGQSYAEGRFEVVVVDDSSSDRTVELLTAESFPRLTVVQRPRRQGKCSAIFEGVAESDAEVILLTDANVFLEANAMETLVRSLVAQNVPCISGNVRLTRPTDTALNAETFYQNFESKLQHCESRLSSAVSVDGGLYAIYRRELRVPPHDTILDDFAISMAVIEAGGKIGVELGAIAREASSSGVMEEFRRRTRLAEGSIQILRRGIFPSPRRPIVFWQFVSHKLLRWITPALVMFLCFSLIGLSSQSMETRIPIGLLAFALLISLAGLVLPKLRHWRIVSLLSYFLLVQFATVWGTLRGLCCLPSPSWQHTQRYPV